MTIPRRKLLRLAAGAAVLPAMSRAATAQDYPTRPIRLIVGFQPGTAPDVIARLIGQRFAEQLGKSVIVENHAGASSNIAAEFVVRAPPDGYTLFELTSVNSWNVALYDNLKFDLLRDLAPIASIYRGIGVVVVQPSSPANTLGELIAYAKANPGKLRMGSAGVGTPQHLYGEMFKQRCGIDMLHVPYRGGGRALADLLGGQVDIIFDTLVTAIGHIRSNEARALGVTSPRRIELLPDVPPLRKSYLAMKRKLGRELPHRQTRPPRSSTSSTSRSMQRWPIRHSRRASPIWAECRLQPHRRNSAISSPSIPPRGAT